MTLNELAANLGITDELSDSLRKSYEKLGGSGKLYDREYLLKIQNEYSVFDEDVFLALTESFDAFSKNENLVKWAMLLRQVLLDSEDHDELYSVPMPSMDTSAGRDMIALFPLLSFFDEALEKYEKIGFSRKEALKELSFFGKCTARSPEGRIYFPSGLFGWYALYTYATIFRHGVLNFEITEFFDSVVLLENQKNGEYAILMKEGLFHRSGNFLQSAGLSEDTDGSFEATFEENDTEYVGYEAKDGYAINELKKFPKSEWKKVLEKGDKAVSLHIPRGVDVSCESVKKTVSEGMKIVRERYGENIRFAFCRSWLLSPNISQCLNSSSKIIEFSNVYDRFPIVSHGKELMSFLFGKSVQNYEELPENTSLQRKIKKIYLDGGYIYAGAGIITNPDFYKC